MKNFSIGSICAILCLLTHGGTAKPQNGDQTDNYNPDKKLSWSDPFDWKFLKAFSAKSNKNVLLSPFSLKLVLSLLYEGSSGDTEREFQKALNLPANKTILSLKYNEVLKGLQEESDSYICKVGTRAFLDSSIEPTQTFRTKANTFYHTAIESVDFSSPKLAAESINSWVDEITLGKLKKLVNPDDLEEAILLLTNAIYFKGKWQVAFPKNKTIRAGFYVEPDRVINTPFMRVLDQYYYHESTLLEAKIIRIPYKGNKFSMVILLPTAKGGLSQLIDTLTVDKLRNVLSLMDKTTVSLILPKFNFDFQTRLSNILEELGLRLMFQPKASFAGIARGTKLENAKALYVSDVLQKAGIDVNEEGSEAYVATEITLTNKFGENQVTFNATHPFLFFIEEQGTNSILFLGKVENPQQIESLALPSRFGGGASSSGSNSKVPLQLSTGQGFSSSSGQRPTQPEQNNENYNQPSFSLDEKQEAHADFLERFNYIDFELLEKLDNGKNLLISPASIKTILAMILEGAGGQSAAQIASALRLDSGHSNHREILRKLLYDLTDTSGATLVQYFNRLFVSKKYAVNPNYDKIIRGYYNASVRSIDFTNPSEIQTINNEVKESTRGLIPDIVNPDAIPADTMMIITNALYFKGKWKHSFDPKETTTKCFQSRQKGCINVPMMQIEETFNYQFLKGLQAHAVELPYSDHKYAMVLIVPNTDRPRFVSDLRNNKFVEILDKLVPEEITLVMPRFTIEFDTDLTEVLQQRPPEIVDIFGAQANLTGIITNANTHVSQIIHKAKIIVNEHGTEAAAASGAVFIPLMGSMKPRVVADRPFVFIIYHRASKNIIFEGVLNEPTPSSDEYKPQGNGYQQPKQTNFDTQDSRRPQATESRSSFPTNQYYQPQQKTPINYGTYRTISQLRYYNGE